MTMTMSRTIYGYTAERLVTNCPLILSILLDDEKIYPLDLQPGLSDYELRDAEEIVRVIKGNGPFLGIAGVMLISGPKRAGKGLLGNALAWKLKRYFGKPVLRDDHAPELFGRYTFFNSETLLEGVADMAEIAGKDVNKLSSGQKKQYIREWATERGEVLMQNAVQLKDEFWKDMNKRRGMDPMNLLYGGVLKTIYHLDGFIIGIIQRYHDLDRFTCLPDVNLHVKCAWCRDRPNTTRATIYQVEWNSATERLVPVVSRPTVWLVDGKAPRKQLGGKSWFDIFYSKNAPNLSSLVRRSERDAIQEQRDAERERREMEEAGADDEEDTE